MSRLDAITKNLKFAALSELLLAVAKFLLRRVFVLQLGKEYLGISGLFSDILSMLSLAELGFGASVLYSLYRPVARGDRETIKSLLRLYRRVYSAVGCFVLIAGLSLTPFLSFFVREMPENIPHLTLIYFLNVANSGLSYFFVYKSSLLFACQKKYIDTVIATAVSLGASLLQITVLLTARSYLGYLLIGIAATLAHNFATAHATDRLYPWAREERVRPLSRELRRELSRNVSSLMVQKVGDLVVYSTDNLIIAKMIGVVTAGLYSNYIMIRNFFRTVINAIFFAITPTIGSLSVTGFDETKREAFRRLFFLSAWVFGWMNICLFWLYDPFIRLWLGPGYLLPRPAVQLLVVNFYMVCMLAPAVRTKNAMGLFWADRYKALPEAALNLLFSVALTRRWGITGVIAGTVLSMAAVSFWVDPLVLCRCGLGLRLREYFSRYARFLLVTLAAGALTGLLCRTAGDTIPGFLLRLLLCGVVPNLVFWAVYRRTAEFLYFKDILKQLVPRNREKAGGQRRNGGNA